MNVRSAIYDLRSSESPPASFFPPFARSRTRNFFPLFFFFYLYVARFNDTKVTYNSIRTLSRSSFSLSRPLSLLLHSLFFSLSNTGRVLSDKNSSLNKHTIQKLLSYRLTASVKRVVLFYHYFFFFSRPALPPPFLPP